MDRHILSGGCMILGIYREVSDCLMTLGISIGVWWLDDTGDEDRCLLSGDCLVLCLVFQCY